MAVAFGTCLELTLLVETSVLRSTPHTPDSIIRPINDRLIPVITYFSSDSGITWKHRLPNQESIFQ